MSIVMFRNRDTEAIKILLKEIGKARYECALKDAGLLEQRPISMSGFYVEYRTDTQDINLYYRYPSNTVFFIMPVLGFWGVPHNNWELHRSDP